MELFSGIKSTNHSIDSNCTYTCIGLFLPWTGQASSGLEHVGQTKYILLSLQRGSEVTEYIRRRESLGTTLVLYQNSENRPNRGQIARSGRDQTWTGREQRVYRDQTLPGRENGTRRTRNTTDPSPPNPGALAHTNVRMLSNISSEEDVQLIRVPCGGSRQQRVYLLLEGC